MKISFAIAIALVAVCLIAEDVHAEDKKDEKVKSFPPPFWGHGCRCRAH